jgi:adenylyl cyclase-associated protein
LSNTDSCKKCALVVENVVSSLDIVNCKSAQVQVMGKAPTAVVDKTDGLNLFLSRECLDIEIFTAKSSELNVSMPGKTDQDDFVERALPEQLKTTIDGATGALMTVVVEHKG